MIAIAGAGAFGTALAVALGREGRAVTLWARDVGENTGVVAADEREPL
jgi:glycerol-3-phosphate dehydrogenase (NAD(P)+)